MARTVRGLVAWLRGRLRRPVAQPDAEWLELVYRERERERVRFERDARWLRTLAVVDSCLRERESVNDHD